MPKKGFDWMVWCALAGAIAWIAFAMWLFTGR